MKKDLKELIDSQNSAKDYKVIVEQLESDVSDYKDMWEKSEARIKSLKDSLRKLLEL